VTADESGVASGVELDFESQPVEPIAAGFRISLQYELSKIRPKLIGIHIEDTELIDAVGRIIEVLCVRAFEIPVEMQSETFDSNRFSTAFSASFNLRAMCSNSRATGPGSSCARASVRRNHPKVRIKPTNARQEQCGFRLFERP
jgi:hypothetical protein